MKCAEMLKIKGLCGNETTSSIIAKESPVPARDEEHLAEEQNCSSANSDMIEVEANESDCLEFNEQMIKREINISNLYHSLNLSFWSLHFVSIEGDVESENMDDDDVSMKTKANSSQQSKSMGLIRVKRNLFESHNNDKNENEPKNSNGKENESFEEASNSLIYNKKSMDIYVKPTKDSESSSKCSSPLMVESEDPQFENIVCSPSLMQYQYKNVPNQIEDLDDDDDDDLFIEEANVCSNDVLYNMITQKFENCEGFSPGDENDSDLKRKLLISSVGSLNHDYKGEMSQAGSSEAANHEMKVAIGGLYLRNPRGRLHNFVVA